MHVALINMICGVNIVVNHLKDDKRDYSPVADPHKCLLTPVIFCQLFDISGTLSRKRTNQNPYLTLC